MVLSFLVNMSKIIFGDNEFVLDLFQNEADLEKVVVQNYTKVFGQDTYYFDLKKGIRNRKGDLLTIPDGYLLKFGNKPTMTIIENELSVHDEFKHITVQLAKFHSAITDTSKYTIKKFLLEYLKANNSESKKVNALILKTRFKHISDVLDSAIMENDISYAVIIDEKSDELIRATQPFNPEIYEIKKFTSGTDTMYLLDGEEISTLPTTVEPSEMDVIVCPAREDGFKEVFLQEHRWFKIRVNPSKIPSIKYLAMYEVGENSSINYIGKVKEIKPYKDSGKYEVVLAEPARKLKAPIKRTKEFPHLAPQGPKYSSYELFEGAKKLEDIFPQASVSGKKSKK